MRDAAASKTSILLGMALLLAGLFGHALAGKITNEPNGFNGYNWGTAPTDHPSLKLLPNPAEANPLPFVDVYENPGEALTVNGVTFTRIVYRFYKAQLGNIQLRYEGKENREKLLIWVEDNYGKLPLVERKQKQIEWHGQNTVITLGYDVTTGKGELWFTYLLFSPFDNSSTNTTGY